MAMTALLVGSSGKIGHAWRRLAESHSGDLKITAFPDSRTCDLTTTQGHDALAERIAAGEYDLVVLAAAWTDVDRCEQEPERAHAINAEAVERAARACLEASACLLFYSSDYVFDGTGPKDESAERCPINVYGRAKADAEAAIERSGVEHLIVRINVPLAPVDDGMSFYGHVVRRIRTGKVFEAVADQWSNPLDTGRIAAWSYGAWGEGARGIIHLAGATYASRFDIARAIGEKHDAAHLIKPIRSDVLKQVARRPQRGGLIVRRQTQMFGNAPDLATILQSL